MIKGNGNPEASQMKIGIIGHGFVGKAVDYAFTVNEVTKFLVDPKYDTTIDQLIEWQPNITFICVPTPMNDDGSVDATMVQDSVLKLIHHTDTGIVVKSTVTPDIMDQIIQTIEPEKRNKLVYNPEFLTEANANEQFIEPKFHIMGGAPEATEALERIYNLFSFCKPCPVYKMTPVEASFVKYAINTFLATKVTFFNQLYDSVTGFGGNFSQIINAIGADERIGYSHTRVPGFDYKRGFGGACFPKDLAAFVDFDSGNELLKSVIEINNKYRSPYELGDREKEQHVSFDSTKNDDPVCSIEPKKTKKKSK